VVVAQLRTTAETCGHNRTQNTAAGSSCEEQHRPKARQDLANQPSLAYSDWKMQQNTASQRQQLQQCAQVGFTCSQASSRDHRVQCRGGRNIVDWESQSAKLSTLDMEDATGRNVATAAAAAVHESVSDVHRRAMGSRRWSCIRGAAR